MWQAINLSPWYPPILQHIQIYLIIATQWELFKIIYSATTNSFKYNLICYQQQWKSQ